MWRTRRHPWLAVLVAAALVLAVGIGTSTHVPATSVRAGGDPVIMTAGDIACGANSTAGSCDQLATSNLLVNGAPDAVLPVGDEQYECGELSNFNSYYGPSWGRAKTVTHPAVGNHEYDQTSSGGSCTNIASGAPGYYSYFGSAASPLDGNCTSNCKGYYSFDLGSWHIIALNAQCAYVSCAAGSVQEQWLKADLAAHAATCILAFWHQPRWSSGGSGNLAAYSVFWQDLYNAGADVILSGHDHDYERFAPQDPNEKLDLAHGIREFVVGIGGRSQGGFSTVQPNSELRHSGTYGVLKLTLHPTSYDWQFVPIAGQTFSDSGTTSCSSSPIATTTPVPSNTPVPPTATPAPTTTTTPVPPTATPAATTLFSDGFESGNLSAWSAVQTGADGAATVQSSVVKSGSDAAQLSETSTASSFAYARKTLSPAQADLTASGDFQISQEGASGGNVPILRFFDPSGTRLIRLFRQNQSGDKLYVGYGATNYPLSGTLPLRTWAHFDVHVTTAGAASTVEVWLNGTRVYQTSTASLGTAGVATVQIGNETTAQTFTLYADNISVTS